ncbi:MAG: M43 family zinc metalloprotease [Candidatus Kapaibacterium sp.]
MTPLRFTLALLLFLAGCGTLWAQPRTPRPRITRTEGAGSEWRCGSDMMARDRADIDREAAINRMLYAILDRAKKSNELPRSLAGNEVFTIPVVVHIIHNGGIENITDAQVVAGVQHMNDAYANVGVYDSTTGVNVGIQFCLASRDPNGAFTTGITRTRSALTDMTLENDDIPLKNLSRWDPYHYLNIWLVREITSLSVGPGVAGYGMFPSSHGMNNDGIVGEARWFGSSTDNSKIFAHEAGHYLGLYHTFQDGCANDNCLADGDRVCDTPPDGTTIGVQCGTPANSCTTDADDKSANNPFRPVYLGGLGDQNDLYTDYMDYGRLECYTTFTQGQKERMRATLTTVRRSLLESKGCLSPCTSSVAAIFSASSQTVVSGSTVNFTNASVGATRYEWLVNGVTIATSKNAAYTFTGQGRYIVTLRAFNGNPGCTAEDSLIIDVFCPVRATFTPSSRSIQPGGSVIFTNTSVGTGTYQWIIDDAPAGMGRDLQWAFPAAGGYRVKLVLCSGNCCDTSLTAFISVGTCEFSKRWNIWYFGYGAGIDFNSGQPVALTDGKLYAKDGTSTICDKDGNLLFYSDGDTVWNRRHQVMINGTGLWGHEAATQSATIVPMPGSDSLYYLLTVTDWWQPNTGIRYSIVDMSLDGGLGGITSAKNVPIHDNVSDQVAIAMHSNCHDIWIVTHEMNNTRFLSYLLTPSGLSTNPIITDIGPVTGNASPRFGYLKFTPDGKRLCNALGANATDPTLVMFDFDNSTGVVTNPIILADHDELRYSYSPEFSLDSRYLYISNLLTKTLYQFDLAAGGPAAVRASKLLVATPTQELGGFQMGPDGRIYITSRWSPTISVINYPGRRGAACGFVEGAINLKGRTSSLGLPTRIAESGSIRISGPGKICTGDSVAIYYVHDSPCRLGKASWRVTGNARIATVNDTTVAVHATGAGGATLIVETPGRCGLMTDSLPITLGTAGAVNLGVDTALCGNTSALLDAGAGYSSYRWQDGATTQTYRASGPGIYWVEVTTSEGCTATDTIQVFATGNAVSVNLGPDTTVCDGAITLLDAGPNAARYRWQDGWDGRVYTAFQPGKYWVEVMGYCGEHVIDTINILRDQSVVAKVSLAPSPSEPYAPGTEIAIPLRIDSAANRASLVGRPFRASIHFNSTVLLPIGDTPPGIIQGHDRVITVEGTIRDVDTLLYLQFVVALGDSERTAITIDTFQIADNGCLGTATATGSTVAVAVCQAGHPRLILNTGMTRLAVHAPSVAGKPVMIHYDLIEAGHTRLALVDALGRRTRTLVDGSPGPGEFTLSLDDSPLPSGLYFVVLETPTGRLVERMMVRH